MNKIFLKFFKNGQTYFWSFFITICIYSCSQTEDPRKLTRKEAYELQVKNVRERIVVANDIPVYDSTGNSISDATLAEMNPKRVAFDHFIDKRSQIVYSKVRIKDSIDRVYDYKFDSLLINDKTFLEAFILTVDADEKTKNGIRAAYDKLRIEAQGYRLVNINCKEISRILSKALERDQDIREKQEPSFLTSSLIDRENQKIVMSIFEKCGVVALENSGSDAIHSAFIIIQHSNKDLMKKYYNHFYNFALKNLLPKKTLALMVDRMRIGNDEKQIFGTQVRKTSDGSVELLPLAFPNLVNAKRDSVGLESLESYLSRF